MMRNIAAFVSGLVFAIGLAVSGMTKPSKVQGFLDVAGDWDPSLAFVMVGAIGVYAIVVRVVKSPRLALSFQLSTRTDIDVSLLAGAAIFGVGWGLAGYCPGPAVTSLGVFAPKGLLFVGAMLAGMLLFALFQRRRVESP